jgi:hypothetical protein
MGRPLDSLHAPRHRALYGGYESEHWEWEKALFWKAPWLNGRQPKDIAPLIFKCLKKKCNVRKLL